MAKSKKEKTKKRPKQLRFWKRADFLKEAKRILRETDEGSDSVLCGAMMLAALREGPGSLKRIAGVLEVDPDRLRWMYDTLRRNKIFGQKKIYCDWFNEEDGGVAFTMDVCVGIGWMERLEENKYATN